MRLIDVGALINDVTERYCKDCERRKGIKNGKRKVIYDIGDAPCRACAVYDMIDALENAPRVDPVKHGHWIEHDVGLICSECGHYTESMYDEPFNNKFGKGWALKRPYYCGYCGAKMDEVLNVPLRNGKSMMELERLMDEVATDGE